MENNFDIESFLSLEDYATETRVARRKKDLNTQEFFTPYSIVKRMCDKIASETWADPSKTFLEPCAGNFQFILFILYRRIVEYHIDWKTALQTTYGLELMPDNVQEGRDRVHALLRQISPKYVKSEADSIMDHNFVCHDFFTWDFINWREMTADEIQEITKKKSKKDKKSKKEKEIPVKSPEIPQKLSDIIPEIKRQTENDQKTTRKQTEKRFPVQLSFDF